MPGSVSVVRCENYNLSRVDAAIRKALSYFGGIQAFIKPGDRVCLKPNLLSDSRPESAIVTHPIIVEAVAKMVIEAKGQPIIVDSPGAGIPYTVDALKKVYQAAGYDKILPDVSNILNLDTTWSLVPNPQARLVKKLEVINPVLNCTKIINLPKFKTHTFTIFSGAVKNMFGIVPGFVKPSYHARLNDVLHFSEMLLDLITLIKPTINIMDGVIGIEGDGPGALGMIRNIGLIILSTDAILLDAVSVKLAEMDTQTIPFLTAAKKRGLWQDTEEETKLCEGKLEEFKLTNFQMPKTYDPKGFGLRPVYQKLISPLVKSTFSLKPVIRRAKCSGCGACAQGCPMRAIKIINRKARIKYSACIRCYCCVESCPEAAIEPKLPWQTRLLYHTGVMGLFQSARLKKPGSIIK
ncbi:MAG: DUF362 domain-containing protein [candidate division WOR-3 bacterium]|nr:DUF362 domain-containing protein [candidate division WOR-3 bacterium]